MKKLNVPAVQSQRDSRWASIVLGNNTNSSYNIGQYGCLITSFANYLGISPVDVNSHKDLFVSDSGDLIWSKTSVIGLNNVYTSPRYIDLVTSQGIAKMKSLIDEGRPLICEVDFNPATTEEDMHFVLVIGYDDSSPDSEKFVAIDPWTGTEIDLSVYGGIRRAVITFRAYDRILPFYSAPVSDDSYKKQIQAYFNYEISADDVIKFLNDRKTEISNLQGTIGNKDNTISNLNTQIKDLQADKNSLSDKLNICQTTLNSQADCPANLLETTTNYNQVKQDYEKAKGDWTLKEIDYVKQIKTLKTKLDASKKPIKNLIVDIWSSIFNK